MGNVSVHVLQMILAGASAEGVEPAQLFAAVGLEPDALRLIGPDARVPLAIGMRMWHEAVRLTGNEHFGLQLAERLKVSDFAGIGYAVRSSPTVGEGYERVARYLRLMHDDVVLTIEHSGATVRVKSALRSGEPAPAAGTECLMAMLVLIGRYGVGAQFVARETLFCHEAPSRTAEHQRIFGGRVRFGQPRNELVFDSALLSLPQLQAEPGLCALLDRHLQDLIDRLPAGNDAPSFLERVRSCLAQELKRGEPSLEKVAERLHMSSRSLQRRLKDEGTSLQELLSSVRADLAVRHLAEKHESISEIAFLLGFSEVSTFHRAFKRWTGLTPAAYRRSQGIGA